MHLILDVPADWTTENRADGSFVSLAPDRSVSVHGAAMTVREVRFVQWSHLVIAEDLGVEHERMSERTEHTGLQWPVRLVLAGARDICRLYGFYPFLDYAAWAVIHAERGTLDTQLQPLERLLCTGRPDFSTDEVVALAQLWQS